MVREPTAAPHASGKPLPFNRAGMRRLSARYWTITALAALFTLARFSEAFLVLRAQASGLSLTLVPLVMVVMNVVYAGAAFPAGRCADKRDPRLLLLAGLAVLIGADILLALAQSPTAVLLGAALWGLHMALTQGLFARLVANEAPAVLRGTAFGVFNLLSGVAMLISSATAGALWSLTGPAATFYAGAIFAALTATGLMFAPLQVTERPAT
jgi:MFS family permease